MSAFGFAKFAAAARRPHMPRLDSEANLSEAAVGAIEVLDVTGTVLLGASSSSAAGPALPHRDPERQTAFMHGSSSRPVPTAPEATREPASRASRPSLPYQLLPRTSSRTFDRISLDGIEGESSESDIEEAPQDGGLEHGGQGSLSGAHVSNSAINVSVRHVNPHSLQHLREEADFDNTFEPPHPVGPTSTPVSTRSSGVADLDSFVLKPIPMGQKLQCKIIRRKEGIDKLYPKYELYIEESEESQVFILSARKRKKSSSSHYIISTTRFPSKRDKDHIVGSVRSNFLGTAFAIYGVDSNNVNATEKVEERRQEYGVVLYEPNLLGFKGPRKMTVILPAMTREGKRIEIRTSDEKETLFGRYRTRNDRDILTLHNKAPQWNDETQSFVLNFNGRVTLASVKNFQIVHDNDLDYIIMQFGRVSEDTFTVDFQYPMSCIQAFAIALTSFDAKLACE
ncbi:hypothetical protein SpCBS45565_g06711 [Spizellomyces sp. 'palustris']|nr:hypothetical protein SpCBS45565_g06711 [Spizellomyces sp. 'palustris']